MHIIVKSMGTNVMKDKNSKMDSVRAEVKIKTANSCKNGRI